MSEGSVISERQGYLLSCPWTAKSESFDKSHQSNTSCIQILKAYDFDSDHVRINAINKSNFLSIEECKGRNRPHVTK